MSGAHDVARDAAHELLLALDNDPWNHLTAYEDEIKAIAQYLGVEERDDERHV